MQVGDIVKGANQVMHPNWYAVVTGFDDEYVTLVHLPHSPETDYIDQKVLFYPSESETKIVEEVFAQQIDSIRRFGISIDIAAVDLPSTYGLRYNADGLPEFLEPQIDGQPEELDVSLMFRYIFNRSNQPPTQEQIQQDLHNQAVANLQYLANAAGYDGLFSARIAEVNIQPTADVPQWYSSIESDLEVTLDSLELTGELPQAFLPQHNLKEIVVTGKAKAFGYNIDLDISLEYSFSPLK